MKQSVILGVAAVIIVAFAGTLVYTGFNLPSGGRLTQKVSQPNQTGTIKEFTVRGSSFNFNPSSLTVNVGDTVKITFVDQGGNHDLCVQDKGCTSILATGQSATL